MSIILQLKKKVQKKVGVSKTPLRFNNLLENITKPSKELCSRFPLSTVLLSAVSVTPGQPSSENITRKIPETTTPKF